MQQPVILLVETDVLIRHALAEYLRNCGYKVAEAADSGEARQLLAMDGAGFRIMLADASLADVFDLVSWTRRTHRDIEIVVAGNAEGAARKAGELCNGHGSNWDPRDHQHLARKIKRLVGERAQRAG